MSDEQLRREWVLPPITGLMGGIDLSLLDPGDEDDRRLLIRAEHPELHDALEDDEEVIQGGHAVNPRLHLAMHEVVANQIWDDTPPEMWTTARRLTSLGCDRHQVLHMLASVVSTDVYKILRGQPHDEARTVRELGALPDSWESERPTGGNRAARRAEQRRHRHAPPRDLG
jgi:hypothetical protein